MNIFLSHADEVHTAAVSAAKHSLGDWYIGLPLFLLVVFGVGAIVQLTFKKSFITLTTLAVLLLVIGFTTYSISPLVSILSITLGLMGTLILTLTSLGSPQTTPKAPNKEKS